MIKPTVHLNGTSRERLESSFLDARNAVKRALEAVGEAAPNARDYYPQGPDAYAQAVREHSARMGALVTIERDLLELIESVLE